MQHTTAHYDAISNSYREYSILLGSEGNSRGPQYQEVHASSKEYPSYVFLRDKKRIETPKLERELPEGMKEFLFEVNGNKITRVSFILKDSEVSHTQKYVGQEVVDLLAA